MLTPRRKRSAVSRAAAPPSLADAFAEADAEEAAAAVRPGAPASAPPKAKMVARMPRQPLGSVNSSDTIERIGQLESIV